MCKYLTFLLRKRYKRHGVTLDSLRRGVNDVREEVRRDHADARPLSNKEHENTLGEAYWELTKVLASLTNVMTKLRKLEGVGQ